MPDHTNNNDYAVDNPLHVAELVKLVINFVDAPANLAKCARVNSQWNDFAISKLYRGSTTDLKSRTPDIKYLERLFASSKEHFERNMSFAEKLVLVSANDLTRAHGTIHSLLRSGCEGFSSIAIPFPRLRTTDCEMYRDFLLNPRLRCLTIDDSYIKLFKMNGKSQMRLRLRQVFGNLDSLSIHHSSHKYFDCRTLCRLLSMCNLKTFNFQSTADLVAESYYDDGDDDIDNDDGDDLDDGDDDDYDDEKPRKLIKSLVAQKNLQSLGWTSASTYWDFTGTFGNHEYQDQGPCWPKLRVFSVNCVSSEPMVNRFFCAEKLISLNAHVSIFEPLYPAKTSPLLETLVLQGGYGHGSSPWVQNLSTLSNLRILDCLHCSQMNDKDFDNLLKAVPQIECLHVDLTFRFNSTWLRRLNQRCCRLSNFAASEIVLDYEELRGMPPFSRLKFLGWRKLFLEIYDTIEEEFSIQLLEEMWEEIFPKVGFSPFWAHAMGCKLRPLTDGDLSHLATATLSDLIDPKELPSYKQVFDTDDYDDEASAYRKDLLARQTKEFGWPLLPLDAFQYPEEYSSP